MKKKLAWILLAALVIIQFIRPGRNDGPVYGLAHISKSVDTPAAVQEILERSCNDCHSNRTVYPWYFNVQPLAWWLAHHVEEGRAELNFSEFGTYTLKRKLHKLEEIAEQVREAEMPLKSYTLLHGQAALSEEQRQALITWALNARALLDTVKIATASPR